MSAKLSSTLPGMAVLQFLFGFLVFGPTFGQRLLAGLALENATPVLDQRGGHGLQENPFRSGLDDSLGAVLNMELLPQPGGNDDLPLGGKPDGVGLVGGVHAENTDTNSKVRQL